MGDAFLADGLRLLQVRRTQDVHRDAWQYGGKTRLRAVVDVSIPPAHALEILDGREIGKIALADEASQGRVGVLGPGLHYDFGMASGDDVAWACAIFARGEPADVIPVAVRGDDGVQFAVAPLGDIPGDAQQ